VGENSFNGGLIGNREVIVIGGSIRTNRNDSRDLARLKISDPFNGYIDEAALFDTALSTEQIQQVIQAGPLGVVSGKVPADQQPAADDEVLLGMTIQPSAAWADGFLNDMAGDDGPNGDIKIEI
jgi:hypothetical protein